VTIPANDGYAGPYVLPIGRVANIYTKALSAAVALTPAVTTAPTGLYRVTLVLAITTAGTVGNLTLSVLSTGDGGVTQTQSLAAVPVATLGNIAQDSFTCEVGTASNISYQVTAIGLTAGALKYSVRVVVEKLSALT
jgi:hypothetical protein